MKKKLLLTTAFLLSSASVYAACNPNLPACQCAYPKMVNGIIGCTETYCGDKKCMPDGSCCPSDNYCESSEQEKQCCSDGQSCDTTKGCVEKKVDIENSCSSTIGGYIFSAKNGEKFCLKSQDDLNWADAQKWCSDNGMKAPSMQDMCPDWREGDTYCSNLDETLVGPIVWSTSVDSSGNPFIVFLNGGEVMASNKDNPSNAICH